MKLVIKEVTGKGSVEVAGIGTSITDDNTSAEFHIHCAGIVESMKLEGTPTEIRAVGRAILEGLRRERKRK